MIKDGTTLKISNDEYTKISNIIMNESIKINTMNNNKVTLFIDDVKKSRFDTYIKNIRLEEKRQRNRFKKQNERYLEILKKHINLLVS